MLLGFVEYEISDIKDKSEIIYNSFLDLCSFDKNFIDAISRSTNSKINERMGIWKNRLNSIIENKEFYLLNFEQKKKLFDSSPLCCVCGGLIQTFEEADFYDGKLYHKFDSPRLDLNTPSNRKAIKNNTIAILIDKEELTFDDTKDALEFLANNIADKIHNDEHDISRLIQLDFIGTIGTQDKLSTKQGKKHLKKFGILKNLDENQIYIDVEGSRSENIQKIKELASLFSFTKDLKVID